MQFLANENFPMPSIELLRQQGFTVYSIGEEYSGISDEEVIELAQEKQLIILTFDSDYGELIIRHGLPNPPGVIYFRYKGPAPTFAGIRLLTLLQSGETNFDSAFNVIEEKNLRQRKY